MSTAVRLKQISFKVIRYLGGGLLEGGSDTTSAFLQSVVLMLVAFPEVQRKAQEEVDRVIGSERPPTLEDWANLPYLQVSTAQFPPKRL
jgi:cytochrome P450